MNVTPRQVHLTIQEALGEGKSQKLLSHAEQLRQQGFGWCYDGLADWSTADIFTKLREMGIDADEPRFREQAERAGRPGRLEDAWRDGREWDDRWDDFPLLAAEELWRRLTPELPCPEFIADRANPIICAELDQIPAGEEINAALEVIAYIEQAPPMQRPTRLQDLLDCTICSIDEWLLDCILQFGKTHPDAVTRIAEVMSDGDPERAPYYLGDLCVALQQAARNEAALERVRVNLDTFPNDVWVGVKAADVYKALDRDEEALSLYMTAMRAAVYGGDWEIVAERLSGVLEKLGRDGEYDGILRMIPRPTCQYPIEDDDVPDCVEPWPVDEYTPTQLVAGEKIGRNDPCPCGSGKKYKKCCLKNG